MRTSGIQLVLNRSHVIFLGACALAAAGVCAYQFLVVNPMRRCEQSGNWWDPQSHSCAHVIYLPNLTHRPPGSASPVYPTLPKSPEAAAEAGSAPPARR